MAELFTRIYKKFDPAEIKKYLMIYGDLSGSCANCDCMDVRLDMTRCPQCQTEFRCVSFRYIKNHLSKVQKLMAERPHIVIVDFDDYKRNLGCAKAKEFLK